MLFPANLLASTELQQLVDEERIRSSQWLHRTGI